MLQWVVQMKTKGFSVEIQQSIFNAQNGFCQVLNCPEPIQSIHHKLRNIGYNRIKFPKLIHSVFNAVGLCENCHTNNSHLFRITDKEAEIYEDYLRGLKEK